MTNEEKVKQVQDRVLNTSVRNDFPIEKIDGFAEFKLIFNLLIGRHERFGIINKIHSDIELIKVLNYSSSTQFKSFIKILELFKGEQFGDEYEYSDIMDILGIIEDADSHKLAIIDGTKYASSFDIIEHSPRNGYGGKVKYFKRLFDGAVFRCNNVWVSGLSEKVKSLISDTHKFITKEEFESVE